MPLPASPLTDSPRGDVPLIREGKVLTGFILAELDVRPPLPLPPPRLGDSS